MLNKQLEKLSTEDKLQICKAIQVASERTQLDMGEVKTQNSKPSRFWDNLNTALYDYLSGNKYLVKRGPWEMIILAKDGVIFSLMRRNRFESIQKEVKSNGNCQNYLNLLAKLLNKNVISSSEQNSLFQEQEKEENEEDLKLKVEKFLRSVYECEDSITNHIVILFEETSYGLLDIRQVIINKDFDMAEEDNFSHLITLQPSINLDECNDTQAVSDNMATVQLKLKGELKKKANS